MSNDQIKESDKWYEKTCRNTHVLLKFRTLVRSPYYSTVVFYKHLCSPFLLLSLNYILHYVLAFSCENLLNISFVKTKASMKKSLLQVWLVFYICHANMKMIIFEIFPSVPKYGPCSSLSMIPYIDT